MNNYKVSKNTTWKEVEVNEEMRKIPIDWDFQKIGEKIKFNRGGTPVKNEFNYKGDLPWITISDLKKKNIFTCTAKIKKEKNTKVFIKGTLLGSFKMSVGKFAFTTEDCSTNEGIMGFDINETIHNKNYLYYVFPRLFIENALPNQQGVPLLNNEIIAGINFLCPNVKVQDSIASILSHQESIISDMETLVEKYETRQRYLSEELLSGRIRVKEIDGKTVFYKNKEWKEVEVNGEMKEIPMDWEISRISDIFEVQRGSVLSKDYIKNNAGVYPVYSSATENNGSIGNIKTYMFDGEFLTWTTDGVYAGTVFYRSGKFNCTNICGLLKIKDNKKSIKGISYFVKKELIKHVNHIGNSKLMSNTVSNVELMYASEKELSLISGFMNKKEELLETQKKLLKKEKQKFDFLLYNLISGNYLVETIVNEK